jgi:hypothetical protein
MPILTEEKSNMADETSNEDVTFTADYVQKLRAENASWRQKTRDLENQVLYKDVSVEFAKRGIDIDPSLINIPEGLSATEVADKFAAVFHPIQDEQPVQQTRPSYPSAIIPNSTKPNGTSPPAQGAFGGRTLKEVEADPRAREQVRALYREMLRGNSYGSQETIYDS